MLCKGFCSRRKYNWFDKGEMLLLNKEHAKLGEYCFLR